MMYFYLKSALRNLKKNNKFTLINIAGFAFGIAMCLAIVLFLLKEHSYNRSFENAAHISRLYDAKHSNSSVDYRVKKVLLDNFPDIENVCLVQQHNFPTDVQINGKGSYVPRMLSVDNNFFQVFSIPFVAGNDKKPFDKLNSVVLTESIARELFGNVHVVGNDLKIFNEIPLTVSAVIKDFPDNSSIQGGILVNADNDNFRMEFSCEDSNDVSTHRYTFRLYLQQNDKANREVIVEKLNENIDLFKPYLDEAGLLPLTQMYLHDNTHGSNSLVGNAGLMKLLSSIAVIILVLAVINYVNLTVAQQNKRKKDTGVRKTVGAFRENLLYHFLSESVIVALVALFLGIGMVYLLLPVFESIFNTSLETNLLFSFPKLLLVLGVIALVGIVSGIGPALMLTRISPVKVLSGKNYNKSRKSYLRNTLTIFQFAISIILIFCTTVIYRQINYVKNANPGFNEEQLLCVEVPWINESQEQKVLSLVEEIRKSPYVKSVSGSRGVPGRIMMTMGSNIEGSYKNIGVACLISDDQLLSTLGLEIVQGRDLAPGDDGKVCYINEAFYKHFEWENLENKRYNNYGGFDIVGVVKDFHFKSMHQAVAPACIIIKK